ncbi:SulP family inorganic anion transporter [Halomonas eurihalina]|uniref:SulP family inorganic anion transporter n=1 Tax=Halomonas eurihalina TaxID=42566 RepID=A0A5D9DCC5_HALER|nr:SulP family inorganic anion transporter [Halomonas eurihalina]MDR5859282.1 SulP family inorganic anion transporter [Halomonas eurihalina]TZG40892.1 SulP family inorganic anion transporter [Halomonas eurihalina]
MMTSPPRARQPAALRRWLPFLHWLPQQTPRSLRVDAIAGLTGAVLVLPQGVAYALLAGLPPEYGLYAAIVPVILAALFGSSRQMVSGPVAALSIALFSTLQPFADAGTSEFITLAMTLTFLAGAFQLLLGLARLGALVELVSHSVITGFTAGAALIIAASQLPHALGLTHIESGNFLAIWPQLIAHFEAIQPMALFITGFTVITCLAFQRWLPRWPGMIVAIVAATLLVAWLDPSGDAVQRVTTVQAGLPPLSTPDLSLDNLRLLTPGAIALGLLGLVQAVAISRAIAASTGQRLDNNQEFIGQGLSNLGGAFFSGYVSSGSLTRSGLNASAGACSPLAALFSALFLIPILLVAAPLLQHVPMPAISGQLLLVAFKLVDRKSIREALTLSRSEATVLLITFFSTLLLALEFAIYLGVLASLILYLRRTTRPPVVESDLSQAPLTIQQVVEAPYCDVVRIDGSLFFGACDSIGRRLERFEQPDLVILAAGINFIDLSGIHLLQRQARRCHARGGKLHLAWTKPSVVARLQRLGLVDGAQQGGPLVAITM